MPQYTVSYAQNREDTLLSGFFEKGSKGFYIDVGASDPRFYSVTRKFYEEGWHGINVEPNPSLFKLLELDRPRDINLNLGVADKNGSLTLREYPKGDGLSTFSPSIKEEYTDHTTYETQNYKDYEVGVLTLKSIFEQNQVTKIDFMKVDVEGFEFEVLSGNDWSKYRPLVLCIEAEHIVKDWRPLLVKNNYTLVFFDGLNEYYVANEHSSLAENFSYVKTILAAPPIPTEFFEQLQLVSWKNDQSQRRIIQKELTIQSLEAQLTALENQLQARKRIRSLVKQLAQALNTAVLMQIEKLNKPSMNVQAPLQITGTNPKSVIKSLQKYDFDSYFGIKPKTPLSYRVLSTSYGAVRKVVWRAAFQTYQLIRSRNQHA
jgi:FkbM family methyltransferase